MRSTEDLSDVQAEHRAWKDSQTPPEEPVNEAEQRKREDEEHAKFFKDHSVFYQAFLEDIDQAILEMLHEEVLSVPRSIENPYVKIDDFNKRMLPELRKKVKNAVVGIAFGHDLNADIEITSWNPEHEPIVVKK